MGMNLTDLTDDLRLRRMVDVFDDFTWYTDAGLWTKGGSGTSNAVTNSDGVNGLLTLYTGTAANGESWVATTRKNWLLQSAPAVSPVPTGKALVAECRLNYQEANTNKAGIFFGFCDAFATGLLTATTGVPKNSFSGAGIYKQAGDLLWRTISSNSTTQTLHKSSSANAASGGAADQVLRVEARVISATLAEVVYFVDGVPVFDAANIDRNFRVKDQFTITSLNKMGLGAYVLGPNGTTGETVNVDYLGAWNLR